VISDQQSKGSGERRHGVAALSFPLEDLSIVGEFFSVSRSLLSGSDLRLVLS